MQWEEIDLSGYDVVRQKVNNRSSRYAGMKIIAGLCKLGFAWRTQRPRLLLSTSIWRQTTENCEIDLAHVSLRCSAYYKSGDYGRRCCESILAGYYHSRRHNHRSVRVAGNPFRRARWTRPPASTQGKRHSVLW